MREYPDPPVRQGGLWGYSDKLRFLIGEEAGELRDAAPATAEFDLEFRVEDSVTHWRIRKGAFRNPLR